MYKKIFVSLLLSACTITSFCQTTREIKGAVIDKNGNPLPGAKIEATGGAESTVTDADGTFNIEVSRWLKSLTATYPGMASKKIKLGNQDEILFEMSADRAKRWFINLVGFVNPPYSNGGLGAMGGMLGKWGWYGKITQDIVGYEGYAPGIPSISIGGIKRITSGFYAYLGAGYGTTYRCDDWPHNDYVWNPGAIIDFGFIGRIKHFVFNVGASPRFNNPHLDESGVDIVLGLGYAF